MRKANDVKKGLLAGLLAVSICGPERKIDPGSKQCQTQRDPGKGSE